MSISEFYNKTIGGNGVIVYVHDGENVVDEYKLYAVWSYQFAKYANCEITFFDFENNAVYIQM